MDAPAPQTIGGAPVIEVGAGGAQVCVVTSAGLACFGGRNDTGLPRDGTTEDRGTPTPVQGLRGIVQTGAGGRHSCATPARPTAGATTRPLPLGVGDTERRTTAMRVQRISATVAVAAGGQAGLGTSCAVRGNARVQCWGSNTNGSLGAGPDLNLFSAVPLRVLRLADAAQVSIGAVGQVCALRQAGALAC